MGSKIFVCGGPGSGIIVKLCNNLALASQMIGIAEAMNLGKSLGMDPVKLAQVMNVSTSGCWSSKVNNPMPEVASALQSGAAVQNYDGGFAVKLMLKDLGLALDAGLDKQLALPLATSARELYRLISLHGLDDKDFGVVLEFLKGNKKE
jgi:3-hydroxyisobutyrate dehydrogenase